jgi:hypothetical protein
MRACDFDEGVFTMSDPRNDAPDEDAQQADASETDDQTLADADLEQPSTGYEPGEEPKSANADTAPDGDEPSHEAVGIGIVDAAPLETGDDD